jgi:SpoVK/Ycf46/Vps4 family AAA+-type ATPase
MPEMLDKALFRRFDEVMVYPLPEKADIIGIIKNSLQGFSFDK